MTVHKAEPTESVGMGSRFCVHCHERIKRVPGGHGPTWVHEDSGAVAAPNWPPWENQDGSTNVDGFLAAYADDDNTFWRAEEGHIQNVLDTLIERLEH